MDDPRLDKLLWSLRVFRTRPLATAACRAGGVLIGNLEAKPGRAVHLGEVLVVRTGAVTRTLRVIAIPRSRVSAKLLPEFMADQTAAAEYERARQAGMEHMLARQRGMGRPTKKERRDISELFGFG
ncbi:MAG TPA: S4 domain-containing protein [Dongiaceae bacterium]|nr:S4 domain-containing protein [Dongiaceae bacterium]